MLPVVRDFVRLRERLVPYLAAQAAETIRTDRPLMRPMFFDWPHDPHIWTTDPQWMLGSQLLVAPVVWPGSTSRRLYLPEGEWVDAWTGDPVAEGQHEVEAPLNRIPVFAKRGTSPQLVDLFILGR